ncbi:nucleotidyltransferase family protein [Acinetobacter qingfengensis]|uniref:Nucleotidyl transferase n=1 Tax=Acinetobacter qingfengensis TaxID=1262585 RepID=A0A1E7REW8_9GAMM|nr:nucleotidyltransferase family protein [Acinetobacter qingfengensis]KAA8735646.1 nucleotidyltransferase family protein [Acinetobacter qingfengensis]OEY97908.1 nucleotidyl transferase [Acinetobacter qingfengensis]
MKAMILAAGFGNRMRPLTLTTPKPLLQVGQKSLIVWHIEALKKIGVTEIVINAAWLKEKLVETLGDGQQFGVNIIWSLEDEGLETAGGIIQALPHLGEAPFIVVNGDVWTRYDFSQLLNVELADHLAHLVLVDNPPQHLQGDFTLSGQKVFTPDQQQGGETLTFSGISLLSPKLFAGLTTGKRPLAPLLKHAMQQGLVTGEKMNTVWVDVGTPERLSQLDEKITLQMI